MNRYRIAAFAVGITLAVPALCQSTLVNRAKNDELAYMQDEDPAMRRAFEKARATLDDFLAKARKPPNGTANYAVKVGIREGKDTEYFWINDLNLSESKFSGRISNQPRVAKSVAMGDTHRFSKNEIVDWTYIDQSKQRMMGNFTACALLTKEPPAEAAAFKKQYGLSCD